MQYGLHPLPEWKKKSIVWITIKLWINLIASWCWNLFCTLKRFGSKKFTNRYWWEICEVNFPLRMRMETFHEIWWPAGEMAMTWVCSYPRLWMLEYIFDEWDLLWDTKQQSKEKTGLFCWKAVFLFSPQNTESFGWAIKPFWVESWCLHEFPSGAPAFSHSPKTCMSLDVTGICSSPLCNGGHR